LTLIDLSHTHLPGLVQENMIAYMRHFADLPGVYLVDTDEFFCLVTNNGAPGNLVLRSRFAAEDAEQRIKTVFAALPPSTTYLDWFVFPSDLPADLGECLTARGMPGARGGNWLWGDLALLPDMASMPDSFRIERVANQAMLDQWLQTSSAGFQVDLPLFGAAYSRDGFREDAPSTQYIGYSGDTPVTTGTLLDAGGCAAVYDISTPSAYRGRGYGRAITLYMLHVARQRGYSESWIWASDQAASLYRGLGFVDAEFGLREHCWHPDVPF